MKDRLLLIFVKNPVLGTAKTRLAASIGDQKALDIYNFLLQYTATLTQKVETKRRVLYSTEVEASDLFDSAHFQKGIQEKGTLGEKMQAAFAQAFEEGYKRVLIIGSDCYELHPSIVEAAFEALEKQSFTIGPAKDGGYYLLGMRQLESAVFQHKKWSTARVYQDTIIDLEVLGYPYEVLPTLSDIDYLEDLPQELKIQFGV